MTALATSNVAPTLALFCAACTSAPKKLDMSQVRGARSIVELGERTRYFQIELGELELEGKPDAVAVLECSLQGLPSSA